MPKLELTNRELNYLKGVMYSNRLDGHSYYQKEWKRLTKEKDDDKRVLLCEIESNVFNKVMMTETDGFKG